MRTASWMALLILARTVASEEPPPSPPMPLPVLPAAAADTTALRAALQLPLKPPDYHCLCGSDGWHEIGSRSSEALARIAELKSQLRGDSWDAERYDELCHWYDLVGNADEVGACATRAADLYVQRLQLRPNDAELLARFGNLLFFDALRLDLLGDASASKDRFSSASRQLVQAYSADPNCWRAWLTMARLHLAGAKMWWAEYQQTPALDAEPSPPSRPQLTLNTLEVTHQAGPRLHTVPLAREHALILVEVPSAEESAARPAAPAGAAKNRASRDDAYTKVCECYRFAHGCMEKAFAIAPKEQGVRLYRISERVFLATVKSVTDRTKELDTTSVILSDAENLLDLQAALANKPDDIDLIGFVTSIEFEFAAQRLRQSNDRKETKRVIALISERIQRLESIAGRADGPTAARASLLADCMCRRIGQEFRGRIHIQFALHSDPDNPQVWEAYLGELAQPGPTSEYLSVARRCAKRFEKAEFALRLADALAKSGDSAEALRVVQQLRQREPDHDIARLSEAILLLKVGNSAEIPRVNQLLDETASAARECSDADLQTQCDLFRACSHFIGGNAALGRVLLEDLARREPDHSGIKAALGTVAD